MIYFLTTRRNGSTLRNYLKTYGTGLRRTLIPISYEHCLRSRWLPHATYIFADIELLDQAQREKVAKLWHLLADKGRPRLNHPLRTMRRYELLRTLYARGLNRFNVFRVGDKECPQRFPVFVRGENDHDGSRSLLLNSPLELSDFIRNIGRWETRFAEPLITEFCDTSDEDGVFRKYSAFMMDGRILPRHLMFGHQWCLKKRMLRDEHWMKEEMKFVQTNPHEQQLRDICQLARIDYGRIDYSMLDGHPQVWEINTNPQIAGLHGVPRASNSVHARFSSRMEQSFMALDARSPNPMAGDQLSCRLSRISCQAEYVVIDSWRRLRGRLRRYL